MVMMTTVKLEGFPKYRLDTARAEVKKAHARLVRSAAKTGQAAPVAPTIVVVREYVLSRCNVCHCASHGFAGGKCLGCGKGYKVSREVVDLEIVAERPRLAGWEFLGVVEPLEGGNLIRQVPGADVAEGELSPWSEGAIACDHCNARRRRIETFIVRADGSDPAVAAGTYKQVGRQCLAAFLGGKSASAVIAALGWESLVRGCGEEGEGGFGGHGPQAYDPEEFMQWAAASVRINGWVSKTAARDREDVRATAEVAQYLMTPPFGPASAEWHKARAEFAPTDDDKARAAAALAWARELSEATDYERNLRLVARQPALDVKHAGILASAISAHARYLGEQVKRAQRAASPSEHLGTVGEKKRAFGRVVLERVFATETQYGALHIHSFRDATGNAIVWKTGEQRGDIGGTYTLVGTVKDHGEFKGEKQTVVTRCSLEKVAA